MNVVSGTPGSDDSLQDTSLQGRSRQNRRGDFLGGVAHFVVRRRWWVVIGGLTFIVVAAALGGGVQSRLSQDGFDSGSEPAIRAGNILSSKFGFTFSNFDVVVRPRAGTVDSPDVRTAALSLVDRLEKTPHISNVESYWGAGSLKQLRADSGHEALIVATIDGNGDQVVRREPAIARSVTTSDRSISVQVGGSAPAFHEVNTVVEHDLLRSEAVAIPLTLIVLVFVFGSLAAALLPVGIGGFAIIGTLLVLRLTTSFTSVSVFALNLTTTLGLGLAIDYSLFIVARFREELSRDGDVEGAIVRTVRSAGRSVVGSAVIVAIALSTLAVFPLVFLRSFAFSGVAVALLSGAAAVLVLPAILAILGSKVNRFTVWPRSVRPPTEGLWSRMARRVMRQPWGALGAGIAFLLVLGAPFVGIRLGYFDTTVLPQSNQVRQIDAAIATRFGYGQNDALDVVPVAGSFGTAAELDRYAARLSVIPGVAHVDTTTGVYMNGERFSAPALYLASFAGRSSTQRGQAPASLDSASARLSVFPSRDAMTPAGVTLVGDVRAAPAPVKVLVGGLPAQYTDSDAVIFHGLPLCIGLIAIIMLGLLFLLFRSVVVPLKALVLNVLSLSATFGAMVWVFQDGHLSGLLGFTSSGTLLATMPILMFCVAFGLSMDYEVFLVSRIKENYDSGLSNEEAVARGLQQSGRIITAAAILMSIVFLSLLSGSISFIKLFGLGLTVAVLVDAFLVRGVLVPAFMKVAGDFNWWRPSFRRLPAEKSVTPAISEIEG